MPNNQRHWRIKLPGAWPIRFGVSWVHDIVHHKAYPARFWRFLPIKFNLVRLDTVSPSSGYRLWIYTPWRCPYVEIYVDRRRG